MTMKPVLVFDVNETLLDLDSVAPLFDRLFGNPQVLREWFAQLVLYSQALSLAQIDSDFGKLAAGALRMMGQIKDKPISDSDVQDLSQAIGSMPAHGDAAQALEKLRNAGFRLVTLTNSPKGSGPSPLEKAGLADFFEQSFTVQPTGRFKPAPQTYQMVSDALDVPLADLCLVACHTWDTLGMQAMGGKGALVTHGANAPLNVPGVPVPDVVAPTLDELAQAIVSHWG
ncbi:haloacid dehalogenase type II [Paracoccus sp. JM45]|uniref:haloacid dehalogenase type II n=1 Tax=Paracoccus sp. JM45 TaxID=2283626 RepID=UPI000E6D1459|nr:haloacid dehalogenase type II [Paracoccus sp. JM45]RJE79214.1 haloacid dehalogenase type II [Paracoccus sp. JM45]